MPTDSRTSKHRLLDVLMVAKTGHDLARYITDRKAAGDSQRLICRGIVDLTGEDVTEQTLANWGLL